MSNQKHTPEWVEKLNAYGYPDFKGEKHEAFNEGALAVLKHIGLSGIDNPAEWVEKIKNIHSVLGLSTDYSNLDFIDAFIKQIAELESENERLKAELAKLKIEQPKPIERISEYGC